jgi:aminoglycoside/choline kinase family phosphotransferase
VHVRYEPRILGTGGGIKNTADFWDDAPFFVINSDILFDLELTDIYRFHRRHPHPATLVLCDDPRFNSVKVDENGYITRFIDQGKPNTGHSADTFTFTGIQVIDPAILDFIAAGSFSTIIDGYRKAIAAGHKIQAFVSPPSRWNDIGTPARYRKAVFDHMAPKAFRLAYPGYDGGKIRRSRLKGDGSDRIWYRVYSGAHTLVLSDHGIRSGKERSEVDAFVDIGRHLFKKGLPVPEIHYFDTFSGLVFMNDLGDISLQSVVQRAGGPKDVVKLYESVIDRMIKLSIYGLKGFDMSWTYQTARYDKQLILEKECKYFVDAFLNRYLGISTQAKDLFTEFEILAEKALCHSANGFMHRDMQSRNIMVHDDRFYFIDFQGGRIGPIQYDLASLLIDPYVDLSPESQNRLLEYAIKKLSSHIRFDTKGFVSCFNHCAITRNLQILGAFGFLSRVKKKKYFENYIPAAVKALNSRLKNYKNSPFPVLTSIVEKVANEKL